MREILNEYYKRKITALPQNSAVIGADELLPTAYCLLPEAKRRLAILVDRRDWAYHETALGKAKFIEDEWDVEFFYLEDKPVIDPQKFDLLYNFNHTPSEYDRLFHGRLIKGLYSHYYLSAYLSWRYVYNMVKHAAVLVVANKQQEKEMKPYFTNTFVLPDGVNPEVFYFEKERTGDDIVAGWSGNPDRRLGGRRVKRFYEVVEPACREAEVELVTATDLERDELRRMYNETDVVLIASRSEGNPLCLLEAGACSRTVIATSVGIVPEIIEDGINGFIIDKALSDQMTARRMATRLQWCRNNPAEVREMGQRLREKILRDRSPSVTGEAFRNLLNNLINK